MSTLAYPQETAAPSPRVIANALDQLGFASLCVFVFCLPWERGKGATQFLPAVGIVTFALVAFSRVVYPRPRKLWDLHRWMIVFAAWTAATIFWTLDFSATMARIGTYAQLLILSWMVWVLVTTESRVVALLRAYIIGTLVCVYGTFANLLSGRTYGITDDMEPHKGDRYIMTGMNPNDVGLLMVPSLAISLYLLARRKGNPILCWIQFIFAVTTIFLSGSRGALLASSGSAVMFFIVFRYLPRWQRILAGVACACAAAAAFYFVPMETWKRIFHLATDLTQGTMTHRTQIWSGSIEVFRDHPLIGVGADAHPAAVVKIVARPMVAHNTFLSVLVELGVIGELLLLGLLAAVYYCAARMRGLERALWTLLFIGWAIGACAGTWEYRKATWFFFSMVAAHAWVRLKGDVSDVRNLRAH